MNNIKPILFSTPMVVAVDKDTKTQTRRTTGLKDVSDWCIDVRVKEVAGEYVIFRSDKYDAEQKIKCPYGQIGDILWVRETWRPTSCNEDGEIWIEYKAGGQEMFYDFEDENGTYYGEKMCDQLDKMGYSLIGNGEDARYDVPKGENPFPWKPSIHIPKAFCRTFLKIKDLRVERLHKITKYDVEREGVDLSSTPGAHFIMWQRLWVSINGQESFDKNPWLWVIEFEKCEKPQNWPN